MVIAEGKRENVVGRVGYWVGDSWVIFCFISWDFRFCFVYVDGEGLVNIFFVSVVFKLLKRLIIVFRIYCYVFIF